MNYIWWAIVAMGAYGVTAVLLKIGLRQMPAEVLLVITNVMLVAAGFVMVVYRGDNVLAHLDFSRTTLIVLLAGVTLSIGVISYYTALSRGPASVVTSIFALNFAVASLLGFVVLGESVSVNRIVGIILAAIAILLLTR